MYCFSMFLPRNSIFVVIRTSLKIKQTELFFFVYFFISLIDYINDGFDIVLPIGFIVGCSSMFQGRSYADDWGPPFREKSLEGVTGLKTVRSVWDFLHWHASSLENFWRRPRYVYIENLYNGMNESLVGCRCLSKVRIYELLWE